MQPVELTFLRALKVWWSFLWRTWVFMIPVSIVVSVVMFLIIFLTGGLASFRNPQAGHPVLGLGLIMLIYLLFIPAMLVVQVYTLKLALKVKWSDFQLVPVGPGTPNGSTQEQPPTT